MSRKHAPDDIPLAQDKDPARITQLVHQPFWISPDPLGSPSLEPFKYPAPEFLEPPNDACARLIRRAGGAHSERPGSIGITVRTGADPLAQSTVTV